ncbi:MAG: hypothetical protein U9P44_02475 [archaeon]|nr:hypothetical protein [archaeon]
MRLHRELAITLLFLALYTPLSLALWYVSGKVMNLVFVFIIGLSMITAYIYAEIARYKLRRIIRRRTAFPRTYIRLKSVEEIEEEEPENEEPEIEDEEAGQEFDTLVGFRRLFSQEQAGGEAI